MGNRRSVALALLVLLAFAGIADGVYLTQVHLELEFKVTQAGGMCEAFSETGCQVTGGRFGSVAGLPVAVIGIAGSLAVAVLALMAWGRRERDSDPFRSLLFAAALFAVVTSAVMGTLSFIEGKFCPFCVLWYGLNALQLVAAYFVLDRSPTKAVGQALGHLFRPPGLVALGVFVLALGGTSAAYGYVHGVWMAKAKEPPKIPDTVVQLDIPESAARKLSKAAKETGKVDATLVEFSDFECPFCKQFWESTEEWLADTDLAVEVIFMNFPLDSACNPKLPRPMHPQACLAARAAQCASADGKFWEMGSALFANQQTLDFERMLVLAGESGVDTNAWAACVDDPKTATAVRAQVDVGIDVNIGATPTLFINGRRIEGAPSGEALDRAVRDVIDAK